MPATRKSTSKTTRKSASKTTRKPAKSAAKKKAPGFTAEERAAMKEYATELKAQARRRPGSKEDVDDVLAKLASMPEPDRSMGKRLHALITASAPDLAPRTWYGMPAYAKDGAVVCFFQNAAKFKSRYSTLGFSDKAKLDQGSSWPVAYAIMKLTPAEEKKIAALVKKAAK
jgi:uncharacterized protein YdhG (YjbR/CyaY superfamily)